ncbi:Lysosomal Pro-X carboxypeptidase [Phytophthora megakarya]|uniref:Lysosomal Pro-X carboxypeptidase n=1 Tax=Phytophthora megakarya TaxID=4795 RepID=A0A225W639_9STRA|nr:Lysosomal Pro-X carboxypeptidase [Phytophthora megakarya]
MGEARPLLARSVGSVGSSTGSTRSSGRVRIHRWQSLDAPQYYETIYNTIINYAPASVVAFGGLSVLIGVFVLIHTQHLVATAGLPSTSLATVRPIVRTETPIRADTSNCSELWIEQRIDHFSWLPAADADSGLPATYKQRYLLNTQFWDPTDKKAPVFFYTGNEGDVTLYANHTGLIWENAQSFKALVVFAEHRYYGKSFPFGDKYMDHLAYLTHDQALADYTELIYHLQKKFDAFNHPVIAFGGSYGGMLSAWFRMKYPNIIAGAIAASAPIYGFGGFPDFDGQKYWQVVTRDASPAAGSAKNCVPNAQKSWAQIFELAKTESGRNTLSSLFRLCEPLTSEEQGEDLAMSVLFAFDTLAMGNFPYPSSYLTSGAVELPPWPVREACSHLAGDFSTSSFRQEQSDTTLLEALRDAANVFHNATKDLTCFKIPTLWDYDGIWDYQYCTEMLPQETYFSTNGETDMFWPRNTTFDEIREHCQRDWHTTPDPNGIRVSYGDEMLRSASNIVFSNGLLDPWSSAGVLSVPKEAKVTIVEIAEGAHHLDLFFSHPKDPPSVIAARNTEVKMISKWIDEFAAYK